MALFKIKDGVFINPYKPTIIQILSETTATLVWENGSKIDLEGEGVANLAAWLEKQKAPNYVTKPKTKAKRTASCSEEVADISSLRSRFYGI